jgi:thiosulfate/3-mercaptopyruvate sulfurtransferase
MPMNISATFTTAPSPITRPLPELASVHMQQKGKFEMAEIPAGPLVSADWVKDNLSNPKLRIFEVSVDPGVYAAAHIPGAFNLDWHVDLVDTVNRDIASREKLQAKLREAGVDADTNIVIYGDHNNWFAAWGAWVLDVYGLGAKVKLLDGGRKLWEARKLPVTADLPKFAASTLTLADRNEALRARLTNVLDIAQGRVDGKLVDIRSPDEYTGKIFAPEGVKELSIRAGHVPGAENVPWGTIVNEDGTFKPVDEIRAIYAAKGVDGTKPVITYCRIGERSSHSWFALKRILGYDVRNYDGSWTEYGNAVGVPVENTAGTVWLGK